MWAGLFIKWYAIIVRRLHEGSIAGVLPLDQPLHCLGDDAWFNVNEVLPILELSLLQETSRPCSQPVNKGVMYLYFSSYFYFYCQVGFNISTGLDIKWKAL